MIKLIFIVIIFLSIVGCVGLRNGTTLPKNNAQSTWEDYLWLGEYNWALVSESIDWFVGSTPVITFRKFEKPPKSVLFQRRLRNERFNHMYQTPDDKNKLIPLYASIIQDTPFEIIFEENYSRLRITRNGLPFTNSIRVGEQSNPEQPLVGVWGSLPALNEYRLVEPSNYLFYLDIDRNILGFAVRHGTYLFKQIGINIFESNSCFPDGHMRLEIINEDWLLLTPLFILPEEEGRVEPLYIRRISNL
jgi:hypothetical protein